jgi:alpha-methylacyl-CoA racemase
MAAGERDGPLAHVRVLDMSRMYPGACCTSLLADLGADVVKVEGPGGGDGLRFMTPEPFKAAHAAFNRGKRSVRLDLRNPRAGEVLRRLVRDVDVLVESQRPGSLERDGMGYPHLSEENPRLVWCSITGFGPDGPHAASPGHDITYLGYSGVLAQLSGDGRPPVPDLTLSVPLSGVMAAVGILAALSAREQTGRGARIDASLVDSAMWLLAEQIARAATAPGPHWPAMASRAVYRCADGRMVAVASSEPRSWAALCAGLDLPELADHVLGVDEEGAAAQLAARFATKPAAEWVRHPGLAAGVGPIHAIEDLLDDAHVAARKGIVALDDAGTRVLANPLRVDGADASASSHALRPAPELGEHTDEILERAGFSADDIAALHDDGAV